jgi:glutamate 5-kinase
MKKGRIVVRVEISTLTDGNGKLNHEKMDRLAMMLSNLHNSGKELLLVSSGAIALGSDKLNIELNTADVTGLMATAAVGQAELIKLYQKYFDQYNQMVAQVLLASDIVNHEKRKINTQNTFETLLEMNIIPIINENDAVSTSDIELEDNYPLALNVATISNADIILIKSDINSKYIIQPCGGLQARIVSNEEEMIKNVEDICEQLSHITKECGFPESIEKIVYQTDAS